MKYSGLCFITILIISAFILALPSDGLSESGPSENDTPESIGIQRLVSGNTEFAFDLYKHLCKNDGNIFFSPYSITSAFAMTAAGAENNTARQIAETFGFPYPLNQIHSVFSELNEDLTDRSDDDRVDADDLAAFRFDIAQSLWGQDGNRFKQQFTDILGDCYNAIPETVDFRNDPDRARETINGWVSDKTHGQIRDIVPPGSLGPGTELVLVNAIYFESKWHLPFPIENTKEDTFYLLNGERVTTPMMKQTKKYFGYTKSNDYQAVELKYNVNMSMVIILPLDGRFKQVESTLSAEFINTITHKFKSVEINLTMPRFSYESPTIRLKDILTGIGMTDVFSKKADFSGIFDNSRAVLSDVLHKATITVNEEKTVAAAATVPIFVTGLPIEVTLNRPFIFFIRDNKTGAILFMGRILNPVGK